MATTAETKTCKCTSRSGDCAVPYLYVLGKATLGLLLVLHYFFFGGPILIYAATLGASNNDRLMRRYRDNGSKADGKVERRWKEGPENDGGTSWESAIVSYVGPDGEIYCMKVYLDPPLGKRLGGDIRSDPEGQESMPVLFLDDAPSSGIPAAWAEPTPLLTRLACLLFGLFVTYSLLFIFAEDRSEALGISLLAWYIDGTVFNACLIAIVGWRNRSGEHPALTFSRRVEGGKVSDLDSEGEEECTLSEMARAFCRWPHGYY